MIDFRFQTAKVLILFGSVVMLMLSGCGGPDVEHVGAIPREETVSLPTRPPTPKPSPISTRVLSVESLTPPLPSTITPIPDEVRGLVVEVLDSTTVAVVMNGDPPGMAYEVRYIGVEPPPDDNPWHQVGIETNRRLTNLKVVRLVRDGPDTDDEDRLLRHVYLNNNLMSITLAEQGLAQSAINDADTEIEEDIIEAETRAREGNLGLWGPAPTATVTRSAPAPEEGTEESTRRVVRPTSSGRATVIPLSPTETSEAEAEATEEGTAEASPTARSSTATRSATRTATRSPNTDTPEPTESSEGSSSGSGADNDDDSLQGPQ